MTVTPRIATAALLVLALHGCAGRTADKPYWSQAADIDVADYTTFGWVDRNGQPPVTILDNQIRSAIRAQLTARGYVESGDSPDFVVRHEAVEEQSVKQGSPVRIGIGVGTGRGNVGGSVGTSVGVGEGNRVHNQLRVTIRAVDGAGQREAWTGTTAPLPERPDEDDVERAVTDVMKGFPDKEG